MWEQLTPKDIQYARERLAALRTETLSRHAEEIKRLDFEQAEIEAFERLAEDFAERHMNSAASQPTTTVRGATMTLSRTCAAKCGSRWTPSFPGAAD